MITFPTTGLYAITHTDNLTHQHIIEAVTHAIKGGAKVIQYRDKNPHDAATLATQLLTLCHQFKIPLLINDNIELAHQIGADGVHLGKEDGEIKKARHILGDNAIIGVSCYNDIALAIDAEKQGVDYVAFGRFFPSSSKPLAAPAELITLQNAKQKINIPIVAIGGILPDNGKQLLTAGADLLAVIGGVFTENPQQSAHAYTPLFYD